MEIRCLDHRYYHYCIKRRILGLALYVILDVAFNSNLTIPNKLSKIGLEVNALLELRCGIQIYPLEISTLLYLRRGTKHLSLNL